MRIRTRSSSRESEAAMDRYAKHPIHGKVAQELFLPLSGKLVFHDFLSE